MALVNMVKDQISIMLRTKAYLILFNDGRLNLNDNWLLFLNFTTKKSSIFCMFDAKRIRF